MVACPFTCKITGVAYTSYPALSALPDPRGYAARKLTPDLIAVLDELVASDKGLRCACMLQGCVYCNVRCSLQVRVRLPPTPQCTCLSAPPPTPSTFQSLNPAAALQVDALRPQGAGHHPRDPPAGRSAHPPVQAVRTGVQEWELGEGGTPCFPYAGDPHRITSDLCRRSTFVTLPSCARGIPYSYLPPSPLCPRVSCPSRALPRQTRTHQEYRTAYTSDRVASPK